MIRGTTPTHTFNIPYDASLVEDFRVSYSQYEKIIDEYGEVKTVAKTLITKKMGDVNVTLEEKTIKVRLTQEETLLFDHSKGVANAQIRVKTQGGDVQSSRIINFNIFETLNDEVL